MTDCSQPQQCKDHFEGIHRKLDNLDEAVRGNGKPGIMLRLDRLEQEARRLNRLVWMLLGAGATALATGLVMWIAG